VIAAATAFAVLLGGLTFMAHQNVSHAKSQRAAVQAQEAKLRSQLGALAPVLSRQMQLTTLQNDITTLLATDVAWQRMINSITTHLPPGISLVSFAAASTPPAPVQAVTPPAATTDSTGGATATTAPTTPTTVAPLPTVAGTITFQGKATDFPTLARWIDAMGKVPEIGDIYVSSAQRVGGGADGSASAVTFSATATPTAAAASDRSGIYVKAEKK
jgi:Tfp pilus assembly protein PilN